MAFTDPLRVYTTNLLPEVCPLLRAIEAEVDAGYYAAGFISYEASPAFDPALVTRISGPLPLLWFGIYRDWQPNAPWSDDNLASYAISPWKADTGEADYRAAITQIKELIARGDTYQVNYTLRLQAEFAGNPRAFFAALYRAQRSEYCAYVDIGRHILCSASPELFFHRRGRLLTCRPMKGTVGRGLSSADDDARAAWLHTSVKNRAENVMIVDMIRNDLSRIAVPDSVVVRSLFDVERYETLWQLTSTVTAETDASFSEVMAAMFPCASITGAPKIRTSEIIAELESSPRGIYTGAIGYLAPNGDAQFNVAIRTAQLDTDTGRLEYGTGGGITWDSTAEEEYAECRTKALVLTQARPEFSLLETLRWKPDSGYQFLDYHLRRLEASARYFGFHADIAAIVRALDKQTLRFGGQSQRVRLLVDREGAITLESVPFSTQLRRWHVAMASVPIDNTDCVLYHKTTARRQYDTARANAPGYDDVLLWNDREEMTESCLANIVVRRDGRLLTPPVACGLLAGTFRAHLLDTGRIEEAVITPASLRDAEAIFLINSVRGWIPVTLHTELAGGLCSQGTERLLDMV